MLSNTSMLDSSKRNPSLALVRSLRIKSNSRATSMIVRSRHSAANPSQGGLKPELPTWNLDFYQPISYEYNRKDSRAAGPAPAMRRAAEEPTEKLEADVEEVSAQSLSDFVTTVQTTLNVEFDISLPYTILSAGKPTLAQHIIAGDRRCTYRIEPVPKPTATR